MSDDQTGGGKERWLEAKSLFAEARRLPHSERDTFLASIADPVTREQVANLLSAYDDSAVEVEGIVAGAARNVGAIEMLAPDSVVGNYRIKRLLGEGGMGQVYLATRADEQFQLNVAVKVLSTRIPGESMIQRFRSERQILANLNHPGIAKLLDGGETDDGLPYLAMEFVEGTPIVAYCDENRISLAGRLRLFAQVCEAIQHAHQNFVIHRDVKSSNILITADGQPKLLDFGIAKLLEAEQNPSLTVADTRVMTPANASPEQLSGAAITTATDVYGLGLLLYELLTGVSAYEIESSSQREFEKIVCETIPEAPSKRMRSIEPEIAILRDSTLERLRKRLVGDLDVIVMKALRKEPERRYATARALADDIHRYLDHRPVNARPDSFLYRSRKFIRRNTLTVAVTGLLATSLSLFAVTTYLQNQRIAEERDTADQVSDFLFEIFDLAKPQASLGETVTAEDILDNGYEKIREELVDQPRVKARLLWVMGESYRSLGLHDDAIGLLSESAELALSGNMNAADSIEVLGATGAQYSYLGRFAEADDHLRMARERLEALSDAPPDLISRTLSRVASNLNRQDKIDEGLAILLDAEVYAREIDPDEGGDYPNMLHTIGAWHMMLGRYGESEHWLRQALASEHPRYRDPTISRAISLGVLGSVLDAQSRFAEALETLQAANDILIRELGPTHVNVGITYSTIGITHLSLEQFELSEQALVQARDILIESLGEDHYRVGIIYGYLANLERAREDRQRALEYLELSLAIKQKSLGPDHTSLATTFQKMATIYSELNDYQQALEKLDMAMAIHASNPGRQTIHQGQLYATLGSIRFDLNELEAAEQAFSTARTVYEEIGNDRGIALTAYYFGRIYAKQQACGRAVPELEKAQPYYAAQAPRFEEERDRIAALLRDCQAAGVQ